MLTISVATPSENKKRMKVKMNKIIEKNIVIRSQKKSMFSKIPQPVTEL